MEDIDLTGKKVLVTGGSGFIGSHLIDAFLERGAEVVNLDLKPSPYLKEPQERYKYVRGNIRDRGLVFDLFREEKFEIVSHHAANIEVFTGINDPYEDFKTNVEGTINLLDAAVKQETVKKFVYASSGALYGQIDSGHISREDDPLRPIWPYGASKLSAEYYCRVYANVYGLNTVSLRYGIVYGPREWYGRVLTCFLKRALEGKPPIIFGEGDQIRDYVYVGDVVRANLLAIKYGGPGSYYNIAGPVAISMKELAIRISRWFNIKEALIFENPLEGTSCTQQPNRPRLVHELHRFAMIDDKARDELHYYIETQFKDGILQEMEWLKQNPDVWNYKARI